MLGEEQVSLGMGGGHTQFHSKAASWEVPSVNPARGGPAAALGVMPLRAAVRLQPGPVRAISTSPHSRAVPVQRRGGKSCP